MREYEENKNQTNEIQNDMKQEWQPISTAPKDGYSILLWEKHSTSPFVGYWIAHHSRGAGRWSASHEHVDAEGGWDGAVVIDKLDQSLISHWMPLPQPPEQ